MNADSTGALAATSALKSDDGAIPPPPDPDLAPRTLVPTPFLESSLSSSASFNRWSAASSCCDLDVKSMRPEDESEPLGDDIISMISIPEEIVFHFRA